MRRVPKLSLDYHPIELAPRPPRRWQHPPSSPWTYHELVPPSSTRLSIPDQTFGLYPVALPFSGLSLPSRATRSPRPTLASFLSFIFAYRPLRCTLAWSPSPCSYSLLNFSALLHRTPFQRYSFPRDFIPLSPVFFFFFSLLLFTRVSRIPHSAMLPCGSRWFDFIFLATGIRGNGFLLAGLLFGGSE